VDIGDGLACGLAERKADAPAPDAPCKTSFSEAELPWPPSPTLTWRPSGAVPPDRAGWRSSGSSCCWFWKPRTRRFRSVRTAVSTRRTRTTFSW